MIHTATNHTANHTFFWKGYFREIVLAISIHKYNIYKLLQSKVLSTLKIDKRIIFLIYGDSRVDIKYLYFIIDTHEKK